MNRITKTRLNIIGTGAAYAAIAAVAIRVFGAFAAEHGVWQTIMERVFVPTTVKLALLAIVLIPIALASLIACWYETCRKDKKNN